MYLLVDSRLESVDIYSLRGKDELKIEKSNLDQINEYDPQQQQQKDDIIIPNTLKGQINLLTKIHIFVFTI